MQLGSSSLGFNTFIYFLDFCNGYQPQYANCHLQSVQMYAFKIKNIQPKLSQCNFFDEDKEEILNAHINLTKSLNLTIKLQRSCEAVMFT